MSEAQATKIAEATKALLLMDGVDPTSQPITVELTWPGVAVVTLHAVRAGTGNDYERSVQVTADGQASTELEREWVARDEAMSDWWAVLQPVAS